MTAIRDYIDGLHDGRQHRDLQRPRAAYDVVATAQATDPNRLYSIVLMTDGENNAGVDPDQFAKDYGGLPPAVRRSTPTRSCSARAARTRWARSPR